MVPHPQFETTLKGHPSFGAAPRRMATAFTETKSQLRFFCPILLLSFPFLLTLPILSFSFPSLFFLPFSFLSQLSIPKALPNKPPAHLVLISESASQGTQPVTPLGNAKPGGLGCLSPIASSRENEKWLRFIQRNHGSLHLP